MHLPILLDLFHQYFQNPSGWQVPARCSAHMSNGHSRMASLANRQLILIPTCCKSSGSRTLWCGAPAWYNTTHLKWLAFSEASTWNVRVCVCVYSYICIYYQCAVERRARRSTQMLDCLGTQSFPTRWHYNLLPHNHYSLFVHCRISAHHVRISAHPQDRHLEWCSLTAFFGHCAVL